MLDYGAEHIKLRQLDMPRNFFSGNNCVAEYGHFPSNFLVGVSTAASDIQFRRQMRSRPGEPITVAGNPAVKFASASFEAANKTQRRPDFPLFLTRIFLFDFFTIGILPITEGLIFAILYICLLRAGVHPLAIAAIALLFTEVSLVLICIATKKSLVGSKWGADDSAPFWSWRHFAYFFVQDCFFVWCRGALWFCAGTILSNSILRWMGCQIGDRTILVQPMQCSDWNAVTFGNDCVVDGVLQLHTFENMVLKVKRTRVGGRLHRLLWCHGDGRRGHRAGHDALAVVTGPQGDASADSHLRGKPRGACKCHKIARECTTPPVREPRLARLTTPTG